MPPKRTTLLRPKSEVGGGVPMMLRTPTTNMNTVEVAAHVDNYCSPNTDMDTETSVSCGTPQPFADPSPPVHAHSLEHCEISLLMCSENRNDLGSDDGHVAGVSNPIGVLPQQNGPVSRRSLFSSAPKPTKTLLRRTPVASVAPSPPPLCPPCIPPPSPSSWIPTTAVGAMEGGLSPKAIGAKRQREIGEHDAKGNLPQRTVAEEDTHIVAAYNIDPSPQLLGSAESSPTSAKKGGPHSPKFSNTLRLQRPNSNSKSASGVVGGGSRGLTQRSIGFPSQSSGPLQALLGDDDDELIPSSALLTCLTPTPIKKRGTPLNDSGGTKEKTSTGEHSIHVSPTTLTPTTATGSNITFTPQAAPVPNISPDDDPCGDVVLGPDFHAIPSSRVSGRPITTTLLRRTLPPGQSPPLEKSPTKATTTDAASSSSVVGDVGPLLTSNNALVTLPPPSLPTSRPPNPAPRKGFYGLPPVAESIFRRRGVKDLYEWQDHVLSREDVIRGRNFVYSLPTSGGKTLVAEVILLRTLVEQRKSVMFVLPFVALAEEKVNSLREFEDALGIRVEGYYGTVGRHPPPMAPTAFICTMEKANSLYNTLHEEGRAQHEIGCVVVDELHMVGDGRRGAILELLLTKIRVVSKGATQIVGMSATVPNLDQIAAWLGAACYVGTFRPVPLLEHVVCGGAIIPKDELHLPARQPGNCVPQDDHEAVVRIITEHADSSSIVFCATRGQCAEYSYRLVRTMERLGIPRRRPGADALIKELRGCGQESHKLIQLVPFGVAYHNGSLSMEEREIIEKGYRNKTITVLCATSTLAAGVNLPARRVVFKTPYVGVDFLKKSTYLQMCGRAGRAGLDAHGESYLVLAKREFNRGVQLVHGAMEPIRSAVFSEKHSFARMLLESIGVGMLHRSNSPVYNDLFPTGDSEDPSRPSSSLLLPPSSSARAENDDASKSVGDITATTKSPITTDNTSIVQLWARCLLCHSTKQSLPVARVYEALGILEKSDLFGVSLTPSRVEMTPRGGFRGKKKATDGSPSSEIRMPTSATGLGGVGSSSTLGPSLLFTLEDNTLPPPTATPGSMSGGLVAAAGDADSCSLPPPPSSRAEIGDDDDVITTTVLQPGNIAKENNNVDGYEDKDEEEPIMLSLPEVEEYFQLDPVNLLVKSAIVTLVDTGLVTASAMPSTSAYTDDVSYSSSEGGGRPSSTTSNNAKHASPTVHISMGDGLESSPTDLSFELTPFGASAVRSFFEVDEAVLVRDELISLQERGVILSNDLHICYFLTPVKSLEGGHCDWTRYLNVLACMPDIRQTIASSIGVNFGLVHQYAMGLNIPQQHQPKQQPSSNRGSAGGAGRGGGALTAEQLVDPKTRQDFSLQRFFIALSLCDVLNEVPTSVVEERYGHNYGQQQAMLRAASVFSSSIVNFCAAMGWHNLESLFAAYVKRLGFGVKADLLPLMDIPGVKAGKARVLWTAGLKKPSDIAKLSPDEVFQRVKDRCAPDNKTAKFFTRQSAVATVREATKLLQRQLKDKKGELQDMEMQARMHHGGGGGGLVSPTSNHASSFGGGMGMGVGGSSFGSMGPPPTPGGGFPSPMGFAPAMGGFMSSGAPSGTTTAGPSPTYEGVPPPLRSHHPHTTLLPRQQ